MPSNIEKLGTTLMSQMKKSARAAVPTTLELGTITGSLALVTDSISTPIPQKEYMVALHLTHKDYECAPNESPPDVEEHTHRAPSVFRRLQAGDRVLVAWVGYEPVVVDILVSGQTINS